MAWLKNSNSFPKLVIASDVQAYWKRFFTCLIGFYGEEKSINILQHWTRFWALHICSNIIDVMRNNRQSFNYYVFDLWVAVIKNFPWRSHRTNLAFECEIVRLIFNGWVDVNRPPIDIYIALQEPFGNSLRSFDKSRLLVRWWLNSLFQIT